MINKIIQIAIFILIFAYIFYDFKIDKIDYTQYSLIWILVTFFILAISQIVLSLRWMIMSRLTFQQSLETIVVSSALNMLLPAKLGELSKAFYPKKFYNLHYHKSLSFIFLERFFDIFILFLLLIVWSYYFSESSRVHSILIILGLFLLSIVIFFKMKGAKNLLTKIPYKFLRIYTQKIYKVIKRAFDAPQSLLFSTIFIWILYFLSYLFFFCYAASYDLTLMQLVGLFVISSVAISLPISPGGIGTFEGAVVFFLTHFGIEKESAFVSAMLYHLIVLAVDLIGLYIFLLLKNVKLKDLL